MTEHRRISRDDVDDVMEMAEKIEDFISENLEGNEVNLCMSAIFSALINTIISQCDSFEEVLFYRNLLMDFFDEIIKKKEFKEKA